MIISLVFAMDRNRLIGANGDLPWRLPADLKYFKSLTMGKPVLMGRKTYETIGRPLSGRHNIVITRDTNYDAPGCTVVHSPDAALEAAGDVPEVMVIGGAEIFRHFLSLSQRLYVTMVEGSFSGDTYFPEFSLDRWEVVWEEKHEADERNPHPFRFVRMERRSE